MQVTQEILNETIYSLEEYGLTERTCEILWKAGYAYIKDLANVTINDLTKIQNINALTGMHISNSLKKFFENQGSGDG